MENERILFWAIQFIVFICGLSVGHLSAQLYKRGMKLTGITISVIFIVTIGYVSVKSFS